MNCQEIRKLLEAFVDGEIPSERREIVTRHLDGCVPCYEEARALFALAAEARETLGSAKPARDLWPGVAAQIDNARRFERRRRIHPAWWLAAAALFGVAVGAVLMQPRAEPTDALAAVGEPRTSLDVALAGWEQEVLQHRTALLASLDLQRDRMPAESILAVEENLLLIDEAIREIRSALEREPDNPKLNFLLADAYQQEVQLLKRLGNV